MDSQQSGVASLLADLDQALTFMDVADASGSEKAKRRYHDQARKAYDAVLRLSERTPMDTEQRQTIEARLDLLKTWLVAVGQRF